MNDLSLLVSGHCPPSVIRSRALKCTTGELSPIESPKMLALCNLPKAVEAITEVTLNQFESWIYPSKTQRGISLSDIALFEEILG